MLVSARMKNKGSHQGILRTNNQHTLLLPLSGLLLESVYAMYCVDKQNDVHVNPIPWDHESSFNQSSFLSCKLDLSALSYEFIRSQGSISISLFIEVFRRASAPQWGTVNHCNDISMQSCDFYLSLDHTYSTFSTLGVYSFIQINRKTGETKSQNDECIVNI